MDLDNTTLGSIAFYTCDYGFELIGESELYCLDSGEWSSVEPNCTGIERFYVMS